MVFSDSGLMGDAESVAEQRRRQTPEEFDGVAYDAAR
jgi:hypothetical protein